MRRASIGVRISKKSVLLTGILLNFRASVPPISSKAGLVHNILLAFRNKKSAHDRKTVKGRKKSRCQT